MLPFDVHKKLVQSYFECADYFKELLEYKVDQLARGEKAEEGTMDLMGNYFQWSREFSNISRASDQCI